MSDIFYIENELSRITKKINSAEDIDKTILVGPGGKSVSMAGTYTGTDEIELIASSSDNLYRTVKPRYPFMKHMTIESSTYKIFFIPIPKRPGYFIVIKAKRYLTIDNIMDDSMVSSINAISEILRQLMLRKKEKLYIEIDESPEETYTISGSRIMGTDIVDDVFKILTELSLQIRGSDPLVVFVFEDIISLTTSSAMIAKSVLSISKQAIQTMEDIARNKLLSLMIHESPGGWNAVKKSYYMYPLTNCVLFTIINENMTNAKPGHVRIVLRKTLNKIQDILEY